MSSQQNTQRYSWGANEQWKRFILEHVKTGYKNKWNMLYGNLWSVRIGSINKWLYVSMLDLIEKES